MSEAPAIMSRLVEPLEERLLSTDQVAELCHIKKNSVYRYLQRLREWERRAKCLDAGTHTATEDTKCPNCRVAGNTRGLQPIPAPYRLGRALVWYRPDVEAWIRQRRLLSPWLPGQELPAGVSSEQPDSDDEFDRAELTQ